MRYRKSLQGLDHSPSASPTAGKKSIVDDQGGPRPDEVAAGAHPADQRRRRFTSAASMALRKSMDGPQIGQDGAELTAMNLRTLLAKTSAANVSAVVALRRMLHKGSSGVVLPVDFVILIVRCTRWIHSCLRVCGIACIVSTVYFLTQKHCILWGEETTHMNSRISLQLVSVFLCQPAPLQFYLMYGFIFILLRTDI